MKHVVAFKAGRVAGREVPSVKIEIRTPMPELAPEASLSVLERTFAGDARRIADALIHALPGGTLDQLLVCFLQEKASQFRVSYRHEDAV